jgi:polysaccharide deacetylase 2 family uncharacterized protein YibQ
VAAAPHPPVESPVKPAAPTPAAAPPAQAAPSPPAAESSDNPPPSETGRPVVVEEPTTPAPDNEPPPPAALPRETVTVAQLAEPQGPTKEATPAAPPAGKEASGKEGSVQEASAAPAPAPTPNSKVPEWRRLALAAPAANGHPMIAVIIDDMGLDRRRSQEVLDLPGPLTISFMSYAQDMNRQLADARAHGHEIMMHVPMEPLDGRMDPGPGVLTVKLSQAEVRKTLDADLAKFGGYVGINNHMGSRFTADAAGMEVVMQDLRERGLLFIDSLTTDKSVGLAEARRYGVASAGRNVFLDDAGDLISVEFELGKLEEVARTKGNAIAIGHPRDATIKALSEWLPKAKAKGFVLVPVTAVVEARMLATTATR